MNINEMNMAEVEARLAEINAEIETRSGEELEAIKAELVELEQRKAELVEFETRKAQAQELQNNEVEGKVIESAKAEERKEVKVMEYREAFLSKLMGKELDAETRAAYSDLANAGAVVPEELQNDIISKVKEYAPILNEITLLNVPGGVRFAVEGTTNAASTHTELATITKASDDMVEVVLSAYEIAKLIQISATVKAMSMASFESWLISNLAEAIAMKLENLVFNGAGTTEATGILTTITTGVASSISAADIFTLVGSLKSGYARNAKFVMNRKTFFTKVAGLQDKNKNDLVARTGVGNVDYVLLGAPVIFTDSVADDVVIYGDFKKYVANMAAPQNVVTAFDIDTNSYKYLGTAIFDGKVALAEAFKTIQ